MILPLISLQLDNDMFGFPTEGSLTYQYHPFQNLQNPTPQVDGALIGLSINSEKAGINIVDPITIDTEVSYDDSINLIVSDNINPPKIINSRFYQTSTTTYTIADRKGNLDTNIYSEEYFKVETSLIKSVRTITGIDFLGIKDGGNMKVGNYTFYFKLADADGNETDFIAESGKVICHIGTINSPKSIRGGQLDENSFKLIKFRLINLDLAYDYINIYYTRSSGNEQSEVLKTYKINDKFKITNNNVEIAITGYEDHQEISLNDINISYANFDATKTLANCQNITFLGNVSNNYDIFKTLEKYSLFVTPEIVYDTKGIGNLNHLYEESYLDSGYEYYNANNIYYKLGLWDEEIYRYGIVYILNNYTLSPVFNIRGIKTLNGLTDFTEFSLSDALNYTDDYLLENTKDPANPENSKGVFRIKFDQSLKKLFNGNDQIKPIGLTFKFNSNVVNGDGLIPGLKDFTKGFFFVRQKRIPTILAQGVGIATSNKAKIPILRGKKADQTIVNDYFTEGFTTIGENDIPTLEPHLFVVTDIKNNALLCPEANLRKELFNTFFNSSEYALREFGYGPSTSGFVCYDETNNFTFKGLAANSPSNETKNMELTLIEPGIELIRNSKYDFCSKAGDALVASKHVDPLLGNYEDITNSNTTWDSTDSKVRGEFNTYIGTNNEYLVLGKYYNIFQKNYDFEAYWNDYFKIRYNDSGPYFPVSDRISWTLLPSETNRNLNVYHYTDAFFRGDCYINTFTHRMHWNFIDPEMPTNKKVIDPYNWATNFKIVQKTVVKTFDSLGTFLEAPTGTGYYYNKLLNLFTYKNAAEPDSWTSSGDPGHLDSVPNGLIQVDDKRFKKYSEINGLFGAEKINRPDVNAVPLGHWATFKICSNVNLAMRDLDFSNPMEEAIHKQKRGFYPLQSIDPANSLPESNVINSGIGKTTGEKYYYEIPDVPFIKTNFATRICYSNPLQSSTFANGNRVFESQNYQDYTREYGSIVKLIEWYGTLIGIMEHGVIMIPVNERAMMTNATGENVYINTDNVLPKNPKILSNTFGSLWPESVIKTSKFIYGIDTVGKKIWRTNGEVFENISDVKVQKFLNDKIKLFESDKDRTVNVNFVKTHYNAFKYDVLFTFKYDGIAWNLCWNELTEKWTTQYTWFPEFSENINNIFYTFANQESHLLAENKLYKHGFSGTIDEAGLIKPAYWYDEQHPFEYEFIVGAIPGVQKIFENLHIISNFAEPDSFYYEVVGEGFDWVNYKDLIIDLNNTALGTVNSVSMSGISTDKTEANVKLRYYRYLSTDTSIKKLPYIYLQSFDVNDPLSFYRDRSTVNSTSNMSLLRDLTLREHNKTKEKLVNSYQKGATIQMFGRRKGNMQYLEDNWNVQIQPIIFPYAYIKNSTLTFSDNIEMKLRDKYIKIRVKYNGTKYAIINAIRTLFTISHA